MAEVEFCITNTLDQRRYHGVRYGTFCPKRGHPGLGQIVWGDILPYYTRITKKSTAILLAADASEVSEACLTA